MFAVVVGVLELLPFLFLRLSFPLRRVANPVFCQVPASSRHQWSEVGEHMGLALTGAKPQELTLLLLLEPGVHRVLTCEGVGYPCWQFVR